MAKLPTADRGGNSIQLLPRGRLWPVARNSERVSSEARNDVKMSVEDFLTGSLAVSQEDVEPLTADTGCLDRSLKANGHIEKVCAGGLVEISERGRVTTGNNEHVPRIDRLDVHERDRDIVVIDDAGRLVAGENFTEDACGQLWSRAADCPSLGCDRRGSELGAFRQSLLVSAS